MQSIAAVKFLLGPSFVLSPNLLYVGLGVLVY